MTALALALALAASAPADDPAARLEAANTAYRAGDLGTAADGYERLAAEGFESPALHLNLGNARLRLGRRGAAVASYERALRLDPGDADARANLALAREGAAGRVAGGSARSVLAHAAERVPDGAAVVILALAWGFVWVALALRSRAPARARGVLGAVAAAAVAATLSAGVLVAWKAAGRRTPAAIVVAERAQVREGPEEALRPAFEVPEGTKVYVLEVRGAVVRVRLENGIEGWVRAADVEVI